MPRAPELACAPWVSQAQHALRNIAHWCAHRKLRQIYTMQSLLHPLRACSWPLRERVAGEPRTLDLVKVGAADGEGVGSRLSFGRLGGQDVIHGRVAALGDRLVNGVVDENSAASKAGDDVDACRRVRNVDARRRRVVRVMQVVDERLRLDGVAERGALVAPDEEVPVVGAAKGVAAVLHEPTQPGGKQRVGGVEVGRCVLLEGHERALQRGPAAAARDVWVPKKGALHHGVSVSQHSHTSMRAAAGIACPNSVDALCQRQRDNSYNVPHCSQMHLVVE